MNIFHNFLSIFGGVLGKRMLNPEVIKCHEDLITLQTYVQGITMDNKFFIWKHWHLWLFGSPVGGGGGGGSIIRLGPSWFTSTIFNNNLHVKYRSNMIRTFGEINFIFFGVMFFSGSFLNPYIKSRGSRGTEMSENADLITVETYVQQGETIWKPVFHIRAKM